MGNTLYITDLDGTLLNREDRVPAFSIQALNSLIQQGLRLTCATARSWSSAKKVTAGVEFNLPLAAYNGAFLVDPRTGEFLQEHSFSQEESAFVQNLLFQHGVSPLVYAFIDGRERVSWRPDFENDGISHYIGSRRGDERFRSVKTDRELHTGKAFYYTCIGEKKNLLPVWEAVRDREDYTVTFQQELYRPEWWLEIMPKKATKAHAAKELKALLGCEKLVVFGDALNDLPLFQAADQCYAVENAVPELKAAATEIIGGNEENGVARWLLEHGEL